MSRSAAAVLRTNSADEMMENPLIDAVAGGLPGEAGTKAEGRVWCEAFS
jgi:hypothetical protein